MSHPSAINRFNDNVIAAIIPMVIAALFVYSAADSGWFGDTIKAIAHTPHEYHSVHLGLMMIGLWPFFTLMGAEISLPQVSAAGLVVLLAIIGGMTVPILLTFVLGLSLLDLPPLIAISAALGAMATDVPMAMGAFRFFEKKINAPWIKRARDGLKILAIGDDALALVAMLASIPALVGMIAVAVAAADSHGGDEHAAQTIGLGWAFLIEAVVLMFCWFFGQGGQLKYHTEDNRTHTLIVEAPQVTLWWIMAVLNTAYLYLCGIEPILGGCLVMVFAPQNVKDSAKHSLESVHLWCLVAFAIIAGSINIFDPVVWTWEFMSIALVFTMGGFLGKTIGITGGALLGQKSMHPEDPYGKKHFPLWGAIAMGLPGACNGTVAIIFVTVAANKGLVGAELAAQATIGYLLTVPLSYVASILLAGRLGNKVAAVAA